MRETNDQIRHLFIFSGLCVTGAVMQRICPPFFISVSHPLLLFCVLFFQLFVTVYLLCT